TRGIYNKQQFVELAKLCEIKVIAPLPLHYRERVPERENIDGIDTYHPRYFMIPKIGRSLYGLFFYLSLIKKVKKIYENFKFDLIFATWAYPDGFGSFLIAKTFNKPIVIKVHGSDINLYTEYFLRRKMIAYALKNCNKVIAVSKALKERIVKIGVSEDKIVVIPNGVDTDLFKPLERDRCRERLGLPQDKKIVLFVGNLVPVKGVDVLVEAFARLPADMLLVLVGDGPLKNRLQAKVKEFGIENNVIFVGRTRHEAIPYYMNACDIFCLPSLNEGCPNVILEALACGKFVVATKVGSISEIITSGDYGILVSPKNSEALAGAINKVLEKKWNPEGISKKVSNRNWTANAEKIYEELKGTI
ncbi:MAG: hypothetical protein DRP76_00680, partial [Candidatus Omnitrophota bacterium]